MNACVSMGAYVCFMCVHSTPSGQLSLAWNHFSCWMMIPRMHENAYFTIHCRARSCCRWCCCCCFCLYYILRLRIFMNCCANLPWIVLSALCFINICLRLTNTMPPNDNIIIAKIEPNMAINQGCVRKSSIWLWLMGYLLLWARKRKRETHKRWAQIYDLCNECCHTTKCIIVDMKHVCECLSWCCCSYPNIRLYACVC